MLWSQCETGGVAVLHLHGSENHHRPRINHGNPAYAGTRGVLLEIRNGDVEQSCRRRPLWLLDPGVRGWRRVIGAVERDLAFDRFGVCIEQRDERWSIRIVRRGEEVVPGIIGHLVDPELPPESIVVMNDFVAISMTLTLLSPSPAQISL